jgi:hypothetical protein
MEDIDKDMNSKLWKSYMERKTCEDKEENKLPGDINEEALLLDVTKLTSKEEKGDNVKEDSFSNHSKISSLKLISCYYIITLQNCLAIHCYILVV